MEDEQRHLAFEASLKVRLAKAREVKTTVYDPVSLEEFKDIMLKMSPNFLWCDQYSTKHPCYVIPKRITESEGGIWMYAHGWATKQAEFFDWAKAYRVLSVSPGLELLKF